MDEDKRLRDMLDTAIRVGEAQTREAIKYVKEVRALREVIWRALGQLRAGQPDKARRTLEQQIMKDQ
jgi:hypothetical protein